VPAAALFGAALVPGDFADSAVGAGVTGIVGYLSLAYFCKQCL